MIYTPTWEPIGESLRRRIVPAGIPEDEAQRDLCGAILDRKVDIRLRFAADPSLSRPPKLLASLAVEIPPGFSPADIDWTCSQPSQRSRLWMGPSQRLGEPITHYIQQNFDLMGRTPDLIEVRVADVTRIFCTSESPVDAKPRARSLKSRPKHGAKVAAAAAAIKEKWPGGIPAELSAKDRNRQIETLLSAKNLSVPSPRTIQRALALKPRVR